MIIDGKEITQFHVMWKRGENFQSKGTKPRINKVSSTDICGNLVHVPLGEDEVLLVLESTDKKSNSKDVKSTERKGFIF